MKKIISLAVLLIALTSVSFGQNKQVKVMTATDTIIAATNYQNILTESWNWNYFISWTKNDDSLGFVVQQGPNGTDWAQYAGIDTLWSTAATGTVSFEDIMATGKYLRVRLMPTDSAIVKVLFIYSR